MFGENDLKKFLVECEMLQGNINRMCITHDLDELYRMYDFGIRRLRFIYDYRLSLLKDDVVD